MTFSLFEFAGADPTEVYQPWLPMDALQQSLMRLNEAGATLKQYNSRARLDIAGHFGVPL